LDHFGDATGIVGDPAKLGFVEPRPQQHGALEIVRRDRPFVTAHSPWTGLL
jgi:hypothetical protein